MGDLDKTYTCKNCKVVYDPTEPYAGGSTKYCCGLCREEHLIKLGFEPATEEQRLTNRFLFDLDLDNRSPR